MTAEKLILKGSDARDFIDLLSIHSKINKDTNIIIGKNKLTMITPSGSIYVLLTELPYNFEGITNAIETNLNTSIITNLVRSKIYKSMDSNIQIIITSNHLSIDISRSNLSLNKSSINNLFSTESRHFLKLKDLTERIGFACKMHREHLLQSLENTKEYQRNLEISLEGKYLHFKSVSDSKVNISEIVFDLKDIPFESNHEYIKNKLSFYSVTKIIEIIDESIAEEVKIHFDIDNPFIFRFDNNNTNNWLVVAPVVDI